MKVRKKETTGCSAVRLAHLLWEQGVPGSNPGTPTEITRVQKSALVFSYHNTINNTPTPNITPLHRPTPPQNIIGFRAIRNLTRNTGKSVYTIIPNTKNSWYRKRKNIVGPFCPARSSQRWTRKYSFGKIEARVCQAEN